jgi:hypothetical protein
MSKLPYDCICLLFSSRLGRGRGGLRVTLLDLNKSKINNNNKTNTKHEFNVKYERYKQDISKDRKLCLGKKL